ncbi:MAG: acetate--CoA ligase family protein [Gammaproteobacteria bacterium]|nr:acetate--CoA ligase family protein [Gammaproteobacteria bacterium]MDH3450231.1 acetate--CoA ligase family protein [Gammaproteobacteria bacterium]
MTETAHPLDPLLRPASIALVGASDKPDSPGQVLARMVFESDYAGEVYPVNPRYRKIQGRTCYPGIESLPATVDHVVIALGNPHLESALQAAIAHGARAATIYSSGILAQDSEPRLGTRLATMAKAAGIMICGINGMGFYNVKHNLYAGIFPRAAEILGGGISYIAQSGSAFTTLCHNGCRLGFNLCVSAGNEIVTTVADYMDWSLEQPDTRVIGLFLEAVRDPAAFVAALDKAERKGIPVVILKIGKSPLGASMAVTHTGALAGNHAAFEALFRRYGVIEVNDFDEMASILMLLQSGREAADGDFAAVFESGGFRELITDQAFAVGVDFATLQEATVQALKQHLDPGLEAENPLDAWGSHHRFEERFEACMDLLMQDPNVAAGAFISNLRDGYYLSEAIFRVVERVSKKTCKPIALATCYADLANAGICRQAHTARIPVIDGARETLHAFRHLFEYHRFRRSRSQSSERLQLDPATVSAWRQKIQSQATTTLDETGSLALLQDFVLPVVEHRHVSSRSELIAAARTIGYPLVLKTAASGVNHKSDSRGVFVNIDSERILLERYDDLCARLGPDALVSRMIGDGVEIGLGTFNDPQFGPIVMVAAGGVLVELLSDRAVAMCPVDAPEAERMIGSLRANRLLQGVRGKAPANRAALVDAVVRVSQIAFELQDCIAEIDINPVVVVEHTALAVDALILRGKPGAPCSG